MVFAGKPSRLAAAIAASASDLPSSAALVPSSRYTRPLKRTRNPKPAASILPRFPAQVFVFEPGGLLSQ